MLKFKIYMQNDENSINVVLSSHRFAYKFKISAFQISTVKYVNNVCSKQKTQL